MLRFSTALITAIALVPAAASAAPVGTFNFGAACTGQCNTSARVFSATASDGTIVNVRATGWTLAGGARIAGAIHKWDAGLGVISTGEGDGGNNTHTVDNQGNVDFIMFQFDQEIAPISAELNAFGIKVGRTTHLDNDAHFILGGTDAAWTTTLNVALAGNYADVSEMLFATLNNPAQPNVAFNAGKAFGNTLLVMAYPGWGDGTIDGFKLKKLGFELREPPVDVPEPAMLGLLGLGLAGIAAARRRRG